MTLLLALMLTCENPIPVGYVAQDTPEFRLWAYSRFEDACFENPWREHKFLYYNQADDLSWRIWTKIREGPEMRYTFRGWRIRAQPINCLKPELFDTPTCVSLRPKRPY